MHNKYCSMAMLLFTAVALVPGSANAQAYTLWTLSNVKQNECRKYAGWAKVEPYRRATEGYKWPHEPGGAPYFIEWNTRHLNATLAGIGRNDAVLLERLLNAARTGAFTSVVRSRGGSSPSHVNGVVVKSIAYSVGYLNSRGAVSSQQLVALDKWVGKILSTTGRASAMDSKASNATAKLAWGAVVGDSKLYDRGKRELLRVAGNLKRRPTFDSNIRVNNEVLQHVVHGADILLVNGEDLFSTKFGQNTLHDAIRAHSLALIENGTRGIRTNDDPTARNILRPQGWQTHQAWVPIYLSNFPNSGASDAVRKLDRELRKVDSSPYNGLSLAIHSGCYFGRY